MTTPDKIKQWPDEQDKQRWRYWITVSNTSTKLKRFGWVTIDMYTDQCAFVYCPNRLSKVSAYSEVLQNEIMCWPLNTLESFGEVNLICPTKQESGIWSNVKDLGIGEGRA